VANAFNLALQSSETTKEQLLNDLEKAKNLFETSLP
jgi:hypothetical protein